MFNAISFPGDNFQASKILVKNVTAVDTVVGGVYALDLSQSDADTSGASDPFRASTGNIVDVAAGNLRGIHVVTEKVIKAGESGEAVVFGPVKVRVNGAVALTDNLKAVAGQTYLQAVSAVGDTSVGRAGEVNLAATTNARKTFFNGFGGLNWTKAV